MSSASIVDWVYVARLRRRDIVLLGFGNEYSLIANDIGLRSRKSQARISPSNLRPISIKCSDTGASAATMLEIAIMVIIIRITTLLRARTTLLPANFDKFIINRRKSCP